MTTHVLKGHRTKCRYRHNQYHKRKDERKNNTKSNKLYSIERTKKDTFKQQKIHDGKINEANKEMK